jgi:hypothetical protein
LHIIFYFLPIVSVAYASVAYASVAYALKTILNEFSKNSENL